MFHSRRSFIKNSSLAIAGASLLPAGLMGSKKAGEIVGVQLYSIRDDMKKDPLASLRELSKMGYKYVEHANYVTRKFYGYSASEFKKVLDDLGLKMLSGHTRFNAEHWNASTKDFSDSWKYTVEDAAIVGQQHVISPWFDESLRKNYDDYIGFVQLFNKNGEYCKKAGMKFGYHNHAFEFDHSFNGKTLYDILLENTEPGLVVHQLDVGNMYNGGAKAMDILNKYPGRFESMHVKDEIKSSKESGEPYESTILGAGVIGTKAVVDMGRKMGGTKHFIIEQESYQSKTAMESMKEDLAIMKKWGYV
jgi:sugar phosphate isomerase/epimerase